jgi:hypothetical protein
VALSKNQLDEIIEGFISRLMAEIPVDKVILFGSYGGGTPKEHSDIDLAVISDWFRGKMPRNLPVPRGNAPAFVRDLATCSSANTFAKILDMLTGLKTPPISTGPPKFREWFDHFEFRSL